MEADSKTTTDHEEIQKWVESRGGKPAVIENTHEEGKGGLLRIKFDDSEENLKEISWEEFFDEFEDSQLAFLYQGKTATGEDSRFFKFVAR